MDIGNLTPRSSDVVADMRFTGNFGRPDGFGSLLEVLVRRSGEVCLTIDSKDQTWSVELTSEQRRELAKLLDCYEPLLWDPINHGRPVQR